MPETPSSRQITMQGAVALGELAPDGAGSGCGRRSLVLVFADSAHHVILEPLTNYPVQLVPPANARTGIEEN
jgi:hypothetical protein